MASPGRGPVALVGGEEFLAGNEPQDERLVLAASRLGEDRPAFVIATAAVRQDPDRAVATARRWFAALGLDIEELPLRTRTQAGSSSVAAAAASGRFFYLCGGDPGIGVRTLSGTAAWEAVLGAWRRGAPLAGSSAGAMALGAWTLIRARMPGDARREARDALGVVPRVAVIPHYAGFGHRWVSSARSTTPSATLVGIDERTAALWEDGEWRVHGRGGVTLIRGGRERSFAAGELIRGLPAPTR